ncbi:neural-cadherin-like isoform X1 [Arapaima gigas]
MMWTLLVSCLLTPAVGDGSARETLPLFRGHVLENSPVGSRVSGLSIPARRADPRGACPSADARLKLLGEGSEKFRALAHHERGRVLLRTRVPLDREERTLYRLALALCCPSCARAAAAEVRVLDANDHAPAFRERRVEVRVDDAAALRSAVYRARARDADSGRNGELVYFSAPRNGSFFVVPKTGDVLLVDSILGRSAPLSVRVFARDRGRPRRTSEPLEVRVEPRRWRAGDAARPLRRSARSLLDPGGPVVISVSEDANIGSVVMNLNPARFPSAAFELLSPASDSCPVSVTRDGGEMVIVRGLDRETEPVVDVAVKVPCVP